MTLKKKDGTNFNLSCPNPLIKDQERWDKSKLISYNKFGIKKTLYFSETKEELILEEKLPEIITEPEIKIPEIVETSETPEIVGKLESEKDQKIDNGVIEVWCQPKVGKSFKFEAVVVEINDFSIVIYTNVKLTTGSTIYPTNNKRWWEVKNVIEETKDEYLVSSIITNFHPYFV